jgi:PAS domain S-box-containing protein
MTTVPLQTSFLRPVSGASGAARVVARMLRMGRKLVDVEIHLVSADDDGITSPAAASGPVASPPDYRSAFDEAPVGLVISRQRQMVDCNRQLLCMFGATRAQLLGQSFAVLYPGSDEFERTGARIAAQLGSDGRYADERVMPRLGGARVGELFWCRASGRALYPAQPHAAGSWAFEDLSVRRVLKHDFTPREREIAALLIEGLTSKLAGRRLGISPRTVDVYRTRLMRKTGASTAPDLVHKLLAGGA